MSELASIVTKKLENPTTSTPIKFDLGASDLTPDQVKGLSPEQKKQRQQLLKNKWWKAHQHEIEARKKARRAGKLTPVVKGHKPGWLTAGKMLEKYPDLIAFISDQGGYNKALEKRPGIQKTLLGRGESRFAIRNAVTFYRQKKQKAVSEETPIKVDRPKGGKNKKRNQWTAEQYQLARNIMKAHQNALDPLRFCPHCGLALFMHAKAYSIAKRHSPGE